MLYPDLPKYGLRQDFSKGSNQFLKWAGSSENQFTRLSSRRLRLLSLIVQDYSRKENNFFKEIFFPLLIFGSPGLFLNVVGKFGCPNHPENYTRHKHLLGSHMLDNSKGRSQAEVSPWSADWGLDLSPYKSVC
jgi:hypothetical protein